MTTNAIYRCEEFEEAMSGYDELQENHYEDLNEQNMCPEVSKDERENDNELSLS